ncbi:hypothetical protein TARUN_10150 [Trichoderma arundinaceum]|uniref:Tat pathway signal sequence n=1 Tax=Trichoderma arundinaceum TaxID=490622 RepID=A0A395N8H5_TRIAR|nr:hypothetical protein TARUN_10150 [Trichoderma arundinaceum]
MNRLVASVGTETRLFEPDPTFNPLNASDQGWESVMPMGGGFVTIQDWQGKDLPKPIHSRGKDLYSISVFHQLHCLHMLAEEFSNLLEGRTMGGTAMKQATHRRHGSSMEEEMDKDLMMWHIGHCFDYLKSSLTCCADTALEGQKSDTEEPATDGFGARHVCRNFDQVYQWAETHRASDQTGYPHGTA